MRSLHHLQNPEPDAQCTEEVECGVLGILLHPDTTKAHCDQTELYGSQPEMPPVNVPHSFCTAHDVHRKD